MTTSKYDKLFPSSVRIHSGRNKPIDGVDLSVAQETLAQDVAETARVFNNLMNVIYQFSSSTSGLGGLIRTTEDRFDYTYNFSSESGVRPADIGIEGRNIFIYSAKDDTEYSDVDFDELHTIFWTENADGERRPNTVYESVKELKEYVDTSIASVPTPTYRLTSPQRIVIGSNISLSLSEPSKSVSQFAFDPSIYPDDFTFKIGCVAKVTGPTSNLSADVELYSLTDSELITSAALNFTSTSYVQKKSVALSVGASAGYLNDSEALYEVQLTFNNVADGSDAVQIGTIYLIVE